MDQEAIANGTCQKNKFVKECCEIDRRSGRPSGRPTANRPQGRPPVRKERICNALKDVRLAEAAEEVTPSFAEVHELNREVHELKGEVHVLHEDVIDRIKAVGNPDVMTRREVKQEFAELREAFDRRIDPIALTLRDHSAELARLKNPRISGLPGLVGMTPDATGRAEASATRPTQSDQLRPRV